jgi:hypothetical protein
MIDTLIDKTDGFELINNQIAQILADEVANQQILAGNAGKDPSLWKIRVFSDQFHNWEQYQTPELMSDKSPIVNVWFDSSSSKKSASNRMERQVTTGRYNLDLIAWGGATQNNTSDYVASKNLKRAIRLIRNIIMAGEYTYLLDKATPRELVSGRWLEGINFYQPDQDQTNVQMVIGGRLSLSVDFVEYSPQYTPSSLEDLYIDINRAEDGEVISQLGFDNQN